MLWILLKVQLKFIKQKM